MAAGSPVDGGAALAAAERRPPAGDVASQVDVVIEMAAEHVVHGGGVAHVPDELALGHFVLDVRRRQVH